MSSRNTSWMSLKRFPVPPKQEVLSQFLRIAWGIDYPEVGDDELTAAADEVFLDYDRRESSD